MALTPGKAKKMLDDGTVHGRGLTDKQKRYFGAIAGGATPMKKINGGWLDKYAMGGTLPGASGMMYARTNTPEPLYTQSEMKAQKGTREFPREFPREIAIDNTAVRSIKIPPLEKPAKKPPKPDYTPLQTSPPKVLPMFSQDNRTYEQRKADEQRFADATSTNLPKGAAALTYLANPFRLIGDLYNKTVQPAATSLFSTSTLQPATGDFWTSDEVAKQLNLRNVQRQTGQISYGDQLYGNLMQGLPETGWAGLNLLGGRIIQGGLQYLPGKSVILNTLKRIPGYNYVRNTYNYFKRPLGDAVPIGREISIPSLLTRGKTPPNKLLTNPKVDADNFMQQWTNSPGFNERFYSQIKPYNPLPNVRPETIKRTLAARHRELQALESELLTYSEAGLHKALPRGKYLQQQVDDLTMEINQIYNVYYPKLAADNMKLIQSGKFPTVYSSTGFTPGSGGTYYIPHAGKPLNTLDNIFDTTNQIGNKSVVNTGGGASRNSEMLTGIHETLGHASNVGGRALGIETKSLIKGALKPNPRISKGTSEQIKSFLGPDATFDDWAKYLQEPTEMVARVMELRRQYINPKYWGTSKQYDIPDKLIDQMFRDGLSGKSKITPDFFRVIDKKGLKKLMQSLYATVPIAIGADGLLEYETPSSEIQLPKYKDGGWLDKYEVIEDDMGQLTNPGKITKINSPNITMKGVDFPVLGISDTGDKKMMQPGKDYKFDGNSVTEYPMAQGGMNIPLKTINKYGELERLTYPSSVWKDKEGNPQEVSLLDEVVVDYKGPIALAKEQMEEHGIADFLKAGYVKGKSERAYNNIVPEGYGNVAKNLDRVRRYRGDLGRDPEALWHSGPKDNKRHYTIPNREDAFRLYLGMPQVNNSFSVSDYRPGDSKDKSMVYLKPTYFNDEKIRQALVDQYYREVDDEDIKLGDKDIGNERGLPRGQWQGDGTPWPSHDNSLGDFTFHMGEDEKGTYISIYDIWDLNPFQQGKGSSVNKAADELLEYVTSLGKKVTSKSEVSDIFKAGKPFEVYERIYIDPETRKIIQMKQGGSLVKLDQLTNFTNYNTPQPGGWLDKY